VKARSFGDDTGGKTAADRGCQGIPGRGVTVSLEHRSLARIRWVPADFPAVLAPPEALLVRADACACR
jgi:hypothetical protein